MRDVIQRVIATEAEAKRMVETARSEAARIRSDAQKQAEGLIGRARQAAQVEMEKILAAALQEAEREKAERLARAKAEMESQLRFDENTRRGVVAALVRCVCGESTAGGTGHGTANG